MASTQSWIDPAFDGASAAGGVGEVSGALGGLHRTLQQLSAAMAAAFAADALADTLSAAKSLKKEFLVLRLSLGKLRTALAEALSPIAQAVMPAIQNAVYAATRLVRYIGGVIAGLFGTDKAVQSITKSTAAATSAARTLAHFDQINRLSASGGGGEEEILLKAAQLDLAQRLIVSKIQALIKPLQQIDLSAVSSAFASLREQIGQLSRAAFSGLEWAWYNLLVPLAQWTMQDALPSFLTMLSSALGVLNAVIEALKPYAVWLWEQYLKPLAQWTGETVIRAIGALTEKLCALRVWIQENEPLVRRITAVITAFLAVWAVGRISQWLGEAAPLTGFLGTLISALGSAAGGFLGMRTAASDAWTGIRGVFGGSGAWFKGIFNGLIGLVNGLLSALAQGMNALVRSINTLSVSIPDWIPMIGGKKLGFSLGTVSTSQIPYLAQGAVLPANKPFMAVVGDQRHGTNIEAPLATIQEAVALVMQEQTGAIAAGFEACVGVQRDILEAVLGIRIGDQMIAEACARYQKKMAVVRGG